MFDLSQCSCLLNIRVYNVALVIVLHKRRHQKLLKSVEPITYPPRRQSPAIIVALSAKCPHTFQLVPCRKLAMAGHRFRKRRENISFEQRATTN
jgi:hypothetical protein